MSLRSIATDASQVSPPFYNELSRGLPGCGLNTELENLLRVALGVCYVSTRFLSTKIDYLGGAM